MNFKFSGTCGLIRHMLYFLCCPLHFIEECKSSLPEECRVLQVAALVGSELLFYNYCSLLDGLLVK